MRTQAQSLLESTSHLPLLVPPQGPFRMPLAQRVTGQMAPYSSRTHSPHNEHFSSKAIWRFTLHTKSELAPGVTCFVVPSRTDWTPAPQARTRKASAAVAA